MEKMWQEQDNGLLFTQVSQMPPFIREELQQLCLDDFAEADGDTVVVPYEAVVLLSREEQELLRLPALNPYRLSIKANGDLGHNDLHYIVEVLRPDGSPFINPVFHGCLLHIDRETCLLLSLSRCTE